MHSMRNIQYIIPPGLRYKVREFEAHCRVAQDAPIMICGPSGVGKSLFIHIFKQLHAEKLREKNFPATVNCSHFSGDIARSELFGHVRGAFTGAVEEKKGWIEKTDGGVLILEEVGDLPPETQAKLLSFVETGEYHKVGCSRIRRSSLQIIAATNRYENLREDFQPRFFPFHIPPLHERRGDLLYHLAMTIPELIGQLASWEVLALMAHDWPGNVREVERTALLLKRRKLLETEDPGIELWEDVIEALGASGKGAVETGSGGPVEKPSSGSGMTHFHNVVLSGNRTYRLCQHLEKNGASVSGFHEAIRKFHLGIMLKRTERAFDPFPEDMLHTSVRRNVRLGVGFLKTIPAFEQASRGLRLFCHLLSKDPNSALNLLDPRPTPAAPAPRSETEFPGWTSEIRRLAESIGLHPWKKPVEPPQTPDWLSRMSRETLMKTYYRALLEKANGNKAEAARMADLKYTTFREALNKYGIRV